MCKIHHQLSYNSEVFLWMIASSIIIINSYGLIRMFQAYHAIKFENYVLLSGVCEAVCFMVFKVFKYEVVVIIIQFLQIVITLFISRRFLKLYLLLKKKNSKTKIFNTYFIILVSANVVFMLALLGLSIYEFFFPSDWLDHYEFIPYAHSVFSAIVSVLLFIFSLNIGKMIRMAELESDKHSNVDYYLEEDQDINNKEQIRKEGDENDNFSQIIPETIDFRIDYNQKLQSQTSSDSQGKRHEINPHESEITQSYIKSNEIYLSKRKLQLYLISVTNLLSDCLEFIVLTLELFAFPEHFSFSLTTFPITYTGYTLFSFQSISLLGSSLMNFIAFYYVIRDSYEVQHKQLTKESLIIGVIDSDSEEKSNKNITDYLSNP